MEVLPELKEKPYGYFVDITNIKDLAWLYIDDRCVNFNGSFDSLKNSIETFKPWYKN